MLLSFLRLSPDLMQREYSNRGASNYKKYSLVTIVAAWINADTGAGPSMASGNQVWSKN